MKKITHTLVLVICFITCTSFLMESPALDEPTLPTTTASPQDTFPVPPHNEKMLFYVQRTLNKNTIVYELNYNKDSTLNKTEPVSVYWIRYSDAGEVKPLSSLQKKYAYGLEVSCVDSVKKMYKINFVSYKKRDIFLIKSKTHSRYHAYMTINNKLANLSKIFVQIEGGTFWVPHIKYVEASGYAVDNGRPVTEKIIP